MKSIILRILHNQWDMMNKTFKFDNTSIWKYFIKILLNTIFIYLITLTCLILYFNIKDLNLILKLVTLLLIFGWFLVFGFPLFILYFNHRKYSKDAIFKIENNIFFYSNKNQSLNFKFEDIQKIELWLTPPKFNKTTDWQYFGKYHFTSIYLKGNKIINISCLVFDETLIVFPKEFIKRKKKFFPIMKKSVV